MKNIVLFLSFLFLFACGYTSTLNNQNQQDLIINVKKFEGDFQINNFIKNQLKLASNPNSLNNFDLNVKSNYKKEIIAKDSAGIATDYKISLELEFIIISQNNKKINYKENIKIKDNSENFEQSNYEREIKRNFASATKDKLILYLLSINDN